MFCVGILLWELLTERRLFMGMGKSVAQKVKALKIPRLDQLDLKNRPPVPVQLAEVVARALERDRSLRFQSAAQMLAALDNAGVPAAEPAEVATYVEGVAEFELRKQRDAARGTGTPAVAKEVGGPQIPSPKVPVVVPRRETPSRPEQDRANRRSVPDIAPPPPKRVKPTLLGLAPPKPTAALHGSAGALAEPSAPKEIPAPDPGGSVEPIGVAGPAVNPPRDTEEPPTLVADVASIARALAESQRRTGTSPGVEPTDTATPSFMASPTPGDLAVRPPPMDLANPTAVREDDQAFDAELEAVYENPIAVRMDSIDPLASRGAPDSPTDATAGRAVATALADALNPAPLEPESIPQSRNLDDLLRPQPSGPNSPGPAGVDADPSAATPADESAPAAAPDESEPTPAPAAVPLIHDHRFDGLGPRGAQARTSFWVGS